MRRDLRRLGAFLAVAAVLVLAATASRSPPRLRELSGFDHWRHRKLFPSCLSCHAGAGDSRASFWPAPEQCAMCHDGRVQKVVDWRPPSSSVSNLRFTHASHAGKVAAARPDSVLGCAVCHARAGAPWMEISRTQNQRCLDCHGIVSDHLSAPDTACATCHLPLAQAAGLTKAQIAAFSVPPSHRVEGFGSRHGHGKLAGPVTAGGRTFAVAPSCATCHAREFCVSCHVDAPEQSTIQALAADARSVVHEVQLEAPTTHRDAGFLERHGAEARRSIHDCATCHTRESCLTCHSTQPRAVRALPVAGPGRGPGAIVVRRRPASHGTNFSDSHAAIASAAPGSCATCHARSECLDCHRPSAARAAGDYHPGDFLTRHPAAAYTRESSCADCHKTNAFCASCHERAGLVAKATLGKGYHDTQQFFLLGHGQAARQSLESCVSCHTERDCLTCHASATRGGRGFNPHGPGFDAARLKGKNSEMCTACHGAAIP